MQDHREVHRQEGQDDEQGADEQGQGVGADEAVLDAAQPCGHATDRGRAAVDGAVDADPVEGRSGRRRVRRRGATTTASLIASP